MESNNLRVWPGKPYPLGATWTGEGVNFAIFSEHASGVELCLFETPESGTEIARITFTETSHGIWHAFLPDARPGLFYGYRVYGPYAPKKGHRFNAAKLLVDPYAKAVTGQPKWGPEMFAYELGGENIDLDRDYRDNAASMPKSVVVDDAFDWEGVTKPCIPLTESVIYETHVKGFTCLCPEIPEELRGTYQGMAHPAAIAYLKKLGVTAVELLPVHHHIDDQMLIEKGLKNYWGYNTLGYFAPEPGYAASGNTGGQVAEFKHMVKALHAAGIEVLLDVVYNHTCEGNHLGPLFSFRGVDNSSYYHLVQKTPHFYMDFTGCGNSVNASHPAVLQLILDSLRYWVEVMQVDGFRFDLATTLGREHYNFNVRAPFFQAIQQDPVLSQTKLIAEPWDIGDGGYRVGGFPGLWSEWNGKYRDTVRSYWKGDDGMVGEFARRITGSADIYRMPCASVNFVTAHDGFTLSDLVSYNDKHNIENGEENRDGDSHNRSWNCGIEGETDDEAINTLRRRQRRNFLATLLLSQGVPMLTAGDEFGRTQGGNNNAYCQDNPISWLPWKRTEDGGRLEAFTRLLIQFRKEHPVFRRPKYFQGRRIRGTDIKDVMWFNPGGTEMHGDEWESHFVKCIGQMVGGSAPDIRDEKGQPLDDDTFLLLFSAHHEAMDFTLPGSELVRWELLIDTEDEEGFLQEPKEIQAGAKLTLSAHSFRLLRLAEGEAAGARAEAKHDELPKEPE